MPYICHLCSAGKAGDLYTDFSQDAEHRKTKITTEEFMTTYLALAIICPLLLIPGFCIWRVFFDIMHTLDLGIYQYAIPSAMWEMTGEGSSATWTGRSRQIRFSKAYVSYRLWCKANKVISVTKKQFKLKRFRPTASKYPMITQVTAKAAATRSTVYWMDTICESKPAVSDHDKIRALMFSSFVKADVLCRRADRVFTDSEHDQYRKHIERALRAYNCLADESI